MKLKFLITKAREEFEKDRIDERLLRELYQEYNQLEDINGFMKRAKNLFPHLNCGLATVYLRKILQTGKIVNGKYNDNDHTFLLVNEQTVVDITSDQYGGPKVYVGPLQEPWSL